jgi:hypothetical protein
METRKEANSKGTILIADYDFGDVNIERAIIESAGFELVAAQCKSEDEVIEHGRHADGVLAQYAPIGARAIGAFARCRVIARYGTGVDIVDVDAATRRGIQVTNAPNDWCAEEVADHAVALWLASRARRCCVRLRRRIAGQMRPRRRQMGWPVRQRHSPCRTARSYWHILRAAPGQPAVSARERDHHTACRILLGGVNWRRAPDRSRRGRTRVERASGPLARQYNPSTREQTWKHSNLLFLYRPQRIT